MSNIRRSSEKLSNLEEKDGRESYNVGVEVPSDPRKDFVTQGRRIRDRRLKFGLSLDRLAELAGVARYTLIRVEQGKPSTRKTLNKIRHALHLFPSQLVRPYEDGPYAVHRFEDSRWGVAVPKSTYEKQVEDGPNRSYVDDEAERMRLGQLGFQPFYTAVLDSELSGGVSSQAIMEFHRPSWVDRHFGEEFVYCLRGSLTITVDGSACVLRQGDGMTFDATLPHSYAPTHPLKPGESAPQILIVVSMRPGERAPIPLD